MAEASLQREGGGAVSLFGEEALESGAAGPVAEGAAAADRGHGGAVGQWDALHGARVGAERG